MDLPAFANFLAQRDQRHEYEYFRMLLQLLQWQLSVSDSKRWWVNTARASRIHTRTLCERALTRCCRCLWALLPMRAHYRILKAPNHLLYLRTLVYLFPDAKIIWMHRNMEAVSHTHRTWNAQLHSPAASSPWHAYLSPSSRA